MLGDVSSHSIRQAFGPFAHGVLGDGKKLCDSEGVPLFYMAAHLGRHTHVQGNEACMYRPAFVFASTVLAA